MNNSMVVVSQADRDEAQASRIAEGFSGLAREVVTIPFEQAMRKQWLQVDNLSTKTQTAYLHAAAAVARGL